MDTIITGFSELSCIFEESVIECPDQCSENIPSQNLASAFGLHQYKPPPMLSHQPPPAVGHDDDKEQLRYNLGGREKSFRPY